MKQPHHLRFARALALLVVVPGCTGGAPTPTSEPQLIVRADAALVAQGGDAAPNDGDASLDVDAGIPFSSGPIVPPELPEGFA